MDLLFYGGPEDGLELLGITPPKNLKNRICVGFENRYYISKDSYDPSTNVLKVYFQREPPSAKDFIPLPEF